MRRSVDTLTALPSLMDSPCLVQPKEKYPDPKIVDSKQVYPMRLSDGKGKKRLPPVQYGMLHKKATGTAGSSQNEKVDQKGTGNPTASLQPAFSSEARFHFGTGWPGFVAPADPGAVYLTRDTSNGMVRWAVVEEKRPTSSKQ